MEPDLAVVDSFSLSQFWRGAGGLFRAPKALLRSMSKDGGYGKPIVYALLWQYVASAVALLVSLIRPLPTPFGVTGKIALFFLTPPLTLLVGFFFAALFFVIWHLMGSAHNYQTAFRFWALLAPLGVASALLRAVPYASLLVMVFYFYLLVAASVELHAIRPTKAWTVWGVLLVGVSFLVAVAGVIGAVRGKSLSAGGGSPLGGFPSAPGLPAAGPFNGQGMNPEDMEAEMARAKAEYEEMQKKSQSASPQQKKAPVKK